MARAHSYNKPQPVGVEYALVALVRLLARQTAAEAVLASGVKLAPAQPVRDAEK